MTLTYNNTALTRLIPFLFVVMLLFISLTTTGCGFVDNNDSEEITIERVLRYEPESDEHIAGEASTADQAADDEEGAGVGSASGDPYGNPVKDNKK